MLKLLFIVLFAICGALLGMMSGQIMSYGLDNIDYICEMLMASHCIWAVITMFAYFLFFPDKKFFHEIDFKLKNLLLSIEPAGIISFIGTVSELHALTLKDWIVVSLVSASQTLFACSAVLYLDKRINLEEKIKVFTPDEYRKYCIENFRKMWNWIADESLEQKRCVSKYEAILHFGWDENLKCECWCCEYVNKNVNGDPTGSHCMSDCPIRFDGHENIRGTCLNSNSSFTWWRIACDSGNYKLAAMAARRIAELPERKD